MFKNIKRSMVALLLILLMFTLLLSPNLASAENTGRKVIIFILDNTTWSDWQTANDPYLNRLIRQSSIGLLNNQSISNYSRPGGYLTVSGGARAIASREGLLAFSAKEIFEESTARQIYKRRMGKNAGLNEVLAIGLPETISKNMEKQYYEVIPGSLGQSLIDSGLKTGVIGNSDISLDYSKEYLHRESALIAADENGRVDYGNVSKSLLIKDSSAPFGIRTNENLLYNETNKYLKKSDFLVIDFGDTFRADLYSSYTTENVAAGMRQSAIRRAGRFLEKIEPVIKSQNAVLIVASLLPPGVGNELKKRKKEQMTPVLIKGNGWESGYLFSPGTHREGLILNIDLAPSIVKIMKGDGKQPSNMLGRPIESRKTQETKPDVLTEFNLAAITLNEARPIVVISFITFQLIIFLIAVFFLISKKAPTRRSSLIIEALLISVICVPLSTYLISATGISLVPALLTVAIFMIALTIAFTLKILLKKDLYLPFLLITSITVIFLIFDTFFGSTFQLGSIFGFDPIRGSRFFGIGNESMAVIIASTLIFLGLMGDRIKFKNKSLMSLPLLICLVFVIGFPGLGANTGGTITAIAAFLFAALHFEGKNSKVMWICMFMAVFVFLALFVGFDILNGSNSHMGRSFSLVASGGPWSAVIIAKRKMAMNFRILRYSKWSYFLVASFVLMGILRSKPIGLLRIILTEHKAVSASFAGVIAGGIAGFIFNDSGIVIPGIMLSYFMSFILYLILQEKSEISIT